MTFDPQQHLIKVKGGQLYLEVRWRLIWLREEHPDASVEVELIHLDLDSKLAVARATVTLPNGTRASDIGSETERDFPAGWIEKASTKAVGRALAALGFGTQFALELDEGESVAESPVAASARGKNERSQASSARTSALGPSAEASAGSPAPPSAAPSFTEKAAAALGPSKQNGGSRVGEEGSADALLAGLRAEVVALLEHDGAALDLLRAKGTLPPVMNAEQLRKAKDWLLERERRNVPLSVRLGRQIDAAGTPDVLRAVQQEVQTAKDSKGVSQAEYVSLLRDVERRRTELSGPLTASARTGTHTNAAARAQP